MRLKKDTSYEMLIDNGFEAVTTEYKEIGEGHFGIVYSDSIARVTKTSQELMAKGIMMVQVQRDTAVTEEQDGAITVFWLPLTRGRIFDSFYFIPCDSNQQ
ncbi:MAG: hypothetical protein P8J32_07150 [bacterium]|nr:hypothetical protein [bacterium]